MSSILSVHKGPAFAGLMALATAIAGISPAFAVVDVNGIRLLEPGNATRRPYMPPGTTVDPPSTFTPFADSGGPDGGWRNTYHHVWAVTVYAQNGAGQVHAGTFYVSMHAWNGAQWVPNPNALNWLHGEVRSLPGRGWFPYAWSWQYYGLCRN